MKKPRGDAKLKTLPDALQEQLWQLLRRTTVEKAAAWLKTTHGVETSAGALSQFFSWYPRQATLRQAASMSDQLASAIKQLPQLKMTAKDAASIAQVNFEILAAQNRDPELFSALRKGELEVERLRLEREKFEHSKKDDWEHGIDALLAEAKEIPEARRLLEQAHALIKKARS
jgi:hypothetical protein